MRPLVANGVAVLGIGLCLAIAAAPAAGAFIPEARRIARATTRANVADSRTQALQLDLTLRVADREPIGTGTLISHPHGLARLELRDAAGRVERHLRVVRDHTASRGGREIERPRAFLPPLSFLQVDSADTLEQAFADFGLDVDAAALAPCDESICYVLGDPSRVGPPGEPPRPDPSQPLHSDELRAEMDLTPRPTVWIDARSFEIVRMVSAGGMVVRFGPLVDFGGVRFPGSITIEEPGREIVRFDILGVTAVNAPAAGFSRSWLLTPPEDPPPMAVPPAAAE